MCHILHSDWSLLLLVNTQSSLHCKQGMLLVNMQGSLHCKQGVAYRKKFLSVYGKYYPPVTTETSIA